jgi:F0F1-type ATP synthase assembly protein I
MSMQLAHGRRLVPRIAVTEAVVTLLVALGFAFAGWHQALAVLLGGTLVVIGTLLFGWRMFAAGIGSSGTALTSMLVGKAMQWITLALGLFLVIGVWHWPVVPVVSGVIAAQVGFWIGTGLNR